MMHRYNKIIDIVLKNEGGYSNNPHDRGGETIFGISRKHHPSVHIWEMVDELKKGGVKAKDIGDTIAMDESAIDNVKLFYFNKYYKKNRIDEIKDNKMALAVFDYCVHSGANQAIKDLQRVLMVEEDGVIGDQTLRAVNNHIDYRALLMNYQGRRHDFLKRLATRTNQRRFLNGWYNRVLQLTGSVD